MEVVATKSSEKIPPKGRSVHHRNSMVAPKKGFIVRIRNQVLRFKFKGWLEYSERGFQTGGDVIKRKFGNFEKRHSTLQTHKGTSRREKERRKRELGMDTKIYQMRVRRTMV